MAIPKVYLTTVKNLTAILDAIKSAQAPTQFSTRFLESLGFSSTNDRLVIGILQALGFLDAGRKPTERYFRFLDQTQSEIVLAEGIRDAYADLFQVNKNANALSKAEVVNKFKTLSQGQYSESVLDKMGMTFVELAKRADFKSKPATPVSEPEVPPVPEDEKTKLPLPPAGRIALGGLHYNIQLILPESRDPKVYDALFRSLREHLF